MLGRVAVAPAGRGSLGRTVARQLRRQHGRLRRRAKARPSICPSSTTARYFYFGDGHALQGDGEIVGSGLETTMDVTLQFDVDQGPAESAGRASRTTTHIMVAGSIRPLVDAFRIAQVELIEWLVDDYGFEKMEAYQVVSQAGVVAHRQRRRSQLHGRREVSRSPRLPPRVTPPVTRCACRARGRPLRRVARGRRPRPVSSSSSPPRRWSARCQDGRRASASSPSRCWPTSASAACRTPPSISGPRSSARCSPSASAGSSIAMEAGSCSPRWPSRSAHRHRR